MGRCVGPSSPTAMGSRVVAKNPAGLCQGGQSDGIPHVAVGDRQGCAVGGQASPVQRGGVRHHPRAELPDAEAHVPALVGILWEVTGAIYERQVGRGEISRTPIAHETDVDNGVEAAMRVRPRSPAIVLGSEFGRSLLPSLRELPVQNRALELGSMLLFPRLVFSPSGLPLLRLLGPSAA